MNPDPMPIAENVIPRLLSAAFPPTPCTTGILRSDAISYLYSARLNDLDVVRVTSALLFPTLISICAMPAAVIACSVVFSLVPLSTAIIASPLVIAVSVVMFSEST